jgi:glycosyltransferase involved in cell wall biosynthesis
MPAISVLVANHNYGLFLSRCIRSILSQSIPRQDYELVMVDDGSQDSSHAIYENFSEDIRLFKLRENHGLSTALNHGIRHCKGRYIVRVDADDYVHSDFLRILLSTHELFEGHFEAVSCDYFSVREDGRDYQLVSATTNPIACGVMFKADIFSKLGFYDPSIRVGEEVDLMNKFQQAGFKLFNVNLPLYRYVRHDGSLSSTVFK